MKQYFKHKFVILTLFLSLIWLFFPLQQTFAATFTFTAAGDYNWDTKSTVPVMNAIKNAAPNFHIAVGDFRYDSSGSPAGWATNVKGIVGNIPFEIISGNHDASSIDQYISALPDKVGGVQGQYGKEYYFDYPTTGPIARFIFTAPDEIYSYKAGSSNLTWATNAIDDARAKGLKWVIVSHHKNCITAGVKSCELGTDFFNMLLAKKVDVIIQGHEHGYERSKQLKCAKVGSYDATCVVAAGSTFTKGAGSIITVVGTGGQSLRAMNSGDSEYPYFVTTNDNSWGVGKYVVSDTQLNFSYSSVAGGSFSDSFSISGSGTGPTSPPVTTTVTQGPTSPPATPSVSLPPGSTGLGLTVLLHGIGAGGDNQNSSGGGNQSPVRQSRTIPVTLTDKNNVNLAPKQGTLTYNAATGSFRGTIPLDSTLATGAYLVKIKIDNYLAKFYPGIQTITKGQVANLPSIALVTGDSNNDNQLSVLDYNIVLDCFSDLSPAKNCPDLAKKQSSDLNDDNNVNQFDYNLFLRELSVQSGQ